MPQSLVTNYMHITYSTKNRYPFILKTHSSKWIKTKGQQYQKFYWQSGYGGFSIHPAQIDVVKDYISSQDKHHQKRSFKDEYLAFLKEYNINYDERYVWD